MIPRTFNVRQRTANRLYGGAYSSTTPAAHSGGMVGKVVHN